MRIPYLNIDINKENILSVLKTYPLLISVICSSAVLAIVFGVQSKAEEEPVLEVPPAVTTTMPTESTQSTIETQPTEEVLTGEPQFETVSDNYFHDALFIGNSRTVGLSLFGSMPEEATFYATVGMNIYDLMESTAQIPPEEGPEMSFLSLMNSEKFGKIYIMLGINDLGTGTSESFAAYYGEVIAQIRQMQPEAVIYIQSIINISAERDAQGDVINNANIDEKNALLRELADNDHVYYLDVNEVLVDESGALRGDYTSDGIHLGGGSLPLWEDYLREHAIVKGA